MFLRAKTYWAYFAQLVLRRVTRIHRATYTLIKYIFVVFSAAKLYILKRIMHLLALNRALQEHRCRKCIHVHQSTILSVCQSPQFYVYFDLHYTFLMFVLILLTFLAGRYIKSKSGKSLLLLNSYTFYKQNAASGDRFRWGCSSHAAKGCKANLYTKGDIIVFSKNEHTHAPPKYMVLHGQYIKV